MKQFAVAILLFFCAGALPAARLAAPGTINLNAPGALDHIKRYNPEHYRKINAILDGLNQQRFADVPKWLQVNFNARHVEYGPGLLTSYPPQKHLSFTLEGISYYALVTLTKVRAEVVPAK